MATTQATRPQNPVTNLDTIEVVASEAPSATAAVEVDHGRRESEFSSPRCSTSRPRRWRHDQATSPTACVRHEGGEHVVHVAERRIACHLAHERRARAYRRHAGRRLVERGLRAGQRAARRDRRDAASDSAAARLASKAAANSCWTPGTRRPGAREHRRVVLPVEEHRRLVEQVEDEDQTPIIGISSCSGILK